MAKAVLRIKGIACPADLVMKMGSLSGVRQANQNRPGIISVDYDPKKISSGKVFGLAKNLIYGENIFVKEEFTYYAKGLRCPSCEIFLEKRLKSGAKPGHKQVVLEYENTQATRKEIKTELKKYGLAKIFKKNFQAWASQPVKMALFALFLTLFIVSVLSASTLLLSKKGKADSSVSINEMLSAGSQCFPPPTRKPLYLKY